MSNQQPNFEDAAMDEQDEGRPIENASLNTLMQVSEAEVNRQILTARAYPRNNTGFRQALTELVCYDAATALSCLYALKKGGTPVQGPSIRFAESAIQTWGNARCGSRIVDVGEEWITAQGFFWDLEKNTGLAFEIIRRLTDSKGNRYSEDVIMSTGNAASSIALRNAILKGIPKVAWNPVYLKCRQLSVGAGESISEKRDNMVKAFAPLNVDKAQILGLLGKKGMDDVTIDDMVLMAGILNTIKEGGDTVENVFAADNMRAAGAVAPARPRQSEFTRNGSSEKVGDKTEGQKAPETAANSTENGQVRAETASQPGPDAAAQAREAERMDLISDAHKALQAAPKVRDVTKLQEETKDAGFMTEAEEAHWDKTCGARVQEIMDAAKAAKAKK